MPSTKNTDPGVVHHVRKPIGASPELVDFSDWLLVVMDSSHHVAYGIDRDGVRHYFASEEEVVSLLVDHVISRNAADAPPSEVRKILGIDDGGILGFSHSMVAGRDLTVDLMPGQSNGPISRLMPGDEPVSVLGEHLGTEL